MGIEYELKIYDRDPKTRLAPAEYKALHPFGTAPVLTDGTRAIPETATIIDYILDRHPDPSLRPGVDHPDRDRHLFWAHASQDSLMPLLLMETVFTLIPERVPFFVRPIAKGMHKSVKSAFLRPRINGILAQAEADLDEAPWFGGQSCTTADILMSYPVESANATGFLDGYPLTKAWLAQVHADPHFQSALKKDGRGSVLPDWK